MPCPSAIPGAGEERPPVRGENDARGCSLGLGSCWIGLARGLAHDPEFVKDLDIPADNELVASIILGYPRKEEMRPSVRDEPKILGWLK